ncbi:hypothetical protein AWM68_01360 [Fictibacillus phosphorivorans]|uniref:Uncharacterized protein n=1 Tax=Fictibacillus phosphorivorans TaxID=1221500 RepID=A0A165P4L6_9BACL|nr:hypothetical protein [Fictibacillus phosphorivorans]KZE68945.1 hypothetical protein AWM68_01360 [Fictibacillus phosphorivorans]
MKEIDTPSLKPDYSFILKTSKESEEFSREQTEAKLLYSAEREVICTENKNVCYETSESLRTFLEDNTIK